MLVNRKGFVGVYAERQPPATVLRAGVAEVWLFHYSPSAPRSAPCAGPLLRRRSVDTLGRSGAG